MAVMFDKKYWPEGGTVIHELPKPKPADLNELWETHENAASTFVAEALIDHGPHSAIHSGELGLVVTTYLWNVGGDTLAIDEPLDEMVTSFASEGKWVRSEAQADECRRWIVQLEQLEMTIAEAKKRLAAPLADYEATKMNGGPE